MRLALNQDPRPWGRLVTGLKARLATGLKARLAAGFRGRRVVGMRRFLLYLGLQTGLFALAGPWLALPGLLILCLGIREGFSWLGWARRSWPVLAMSALPAVVGFPLMQGLVVLTSRFAAGDASAFFHTWTPSLVQSARFLMIFASAAWLSQGMSPVELRDVLALLLRPLGKRFGRGVAGSASLAMAFLPWTLSEIRRADEAARLRGSNPGRHPARHLAAMAVPVSVRALEKARLSAEALALREPG
ncbi:MAG: CbiQ family ECF transporter T component [Spirochaetia bacterium]|nr:CbiQ family ECF transporter T component [Spirochaetia bacterium]